MLTINTFQLSDYSFEYWPFVLSGVIHFDTSRTKVKRPPDGAVELPGIMERSLNRRHARTDPKALLTRTISYTTDHPKYHSCSIRFPCLSNGAALSASGRFGHLQLRELTLTNCANSSHTLHAFAIHVDSKKIAFLQRFVLTFKGFRKNDMVEYRELS